jgi:hypothetical protein
VRSARPLPAEGLTAGTGGGRARRNLFRHVPLPVLVKGLGKGGNQLLDEALASNAVLGARGVSVALITAQARNRDVVASAADGRLFVVARDAAATQDLARLVLAGRVHEPWALASLGPALVKARFAGGKVRAPRRRH